MAIEIATHEPEVDRLHHECGVFGVYAPGENTALMAYDALFQLNHRGQEAAGIAVSDGSYIDLVKDTGLVEDALDSGRRLIGLQGDFAAGQVRYGTVPVENAFRAAQPFRIELPEIDEQLVVGHNGHIVNTEELALSIGKSIKDFISDSELLAHLFGEERLKTDTLAEAVTNVLRRVNGAYSLVVMGRHELLAARDPQGFHPLKLGELKNDGWAVASEDPALHIIGAQVDRDIEPGEMVRIGPAGLESMRIVPEGMVEPRLCSFELIYFSRPDTFLEGRTVLPARDRMGELLAKQKKADADIVFGIPESGLPAAQGYARESGIKYLQGIIRNRFISRRIFMSPEDKEGESRQRKVERKLSVVKEVVDGQRVVVVDDSIIRGDTTRGIVGMLREHGAREVHVRITSAPYAWPCFYGMDTGDPEDLLAASKNVDEIAAHIGADSLDYLSLDNLRASAGAAALKLCTACMDGNYPTEVPVHLTSAVNRPRPA